MKKKTISDAPRVFVIDVGGTHSKFLATGEPKPREFDSGKNMTVDEITGGVLARTQGAAGKRQTGRKCERICRWLSTLAPGRWRSSIGGFLR